MSNHVDQRAIDTARVLALDVVQGHGHGHAGAPMALAPVAHVLFQSILRHDPCDPSWEGRDRFVLSAGHASLLLYVQLYLCGYGLTLDDLTSTRVLGSRTPGHPEFGVTPGVEMTTGPLGQGLAAAVGMAMAIHHLHGVAGTTGAPFDQAVWCIASDGDLQEGVSAEASSLAGTLGLGNLVVIWDDNGISIDGPTGLSFTEDVRARYEAYGWRVESVDGNEPGEIRAALETARADRNQPTLLAVKTVIGWPSAGIMGKAAAHAGGYGADVVAETKRLLGFDPSRTMQVDDEVLAHTRMAVERGATLHAAWEGSLVEWAEGHPDDASALKRLRNWPSESMISSLWLDPKGPIATRKANTAVLGQLTRDGLGLWGGSADLSESTGVLLDDRRSFAADLPSGDTVHFGIREHAMAAIMNGIALHGWFRPFGSTYLTFSDYFRPALRLGAMMELPTIYVLTHDSLAVGEDGPTHQPVEQLWTLRMVPNVDVIRPADAHETAAAWRRLMSRPAGPACLVLSRQKLPLLDAEAAASTERGGYVVRWEESPDVLIMATGSEVHLALCAAEKLAAADVVAQVISLPCLEWFAQEPPSYQDEVLPPSVRARVSVEAAVEGGWWRWLGAYGESVSVDGYGLSGAAEQLLALRGMTVDRVVDAAQKSVDRIRSM